jgi:hypothetical protein
MNAWRFFGEEGQPPESMFFGRLGTAVAYPQADGALGFWDYILRFELIVADMQAWPETLDYARRDELSGWKELLGPLESQLEDLARREHYKRGDGCPQCR